MQPSNKVMGKEKSSQSAAFARGGAGHMFGQQHAGTKDPGTSGHDVTGGSNMFARGGSTHMFPRQHADPSYPGSTGGKPCGPTSHSEGTGGGRVTKTLKAKFGS